MELSVIGAGFGRTGTMSLKMALEELGFGPCHHMEELFAEPDTLAGWQKTKVGGPVDWNEVLQGYRSAVDWPSAHFWRELADFYPKAKVVLSLRPAEKWHTSFSRTIQKVLETRETIEDPKIRSVVEFAHTIITEETFQGRLDDKNAMLAAFEKRTQEVCDQLPAERRLLFDVSEGWAPLCAFLGCTPPDKEFPRSNSQDEFWLKFGAGNAP